MAELQSIERSIETNRVEVGAIRGKYIDGLITTCGKTGGDILVAEGDSRVVGFVCVLSRVESEDIIEQDREYAYVTDLIVLEPHRRSGIGAELMRAAEHFARSHGARRIRVGVLAANFGAHALYRKLGYSDREVVLEKGIGISNEAT